MLFNSPMAKWRSIPDSMYIVCEIPNTSLGEIDKKDIRKNNEL